MAIKTPIILLGIATLLMAGCTTAREKAAPPPPVKHQEPQAPASPPPATKPRPAAIRPPSPPTKPRPQATPAPRRPDLATLIGDGASWIDYGNTITIKRGGTAARQPVPLFRQAGMLASVRAALSSSPIQPWAEFRHGLLVLTFTAGSNSEIAAAVNKALDASETRNAKVIVQR